MSKLAELIDLPPVWLVGCITAAWWLAGHAPVVSVSHPLVAGAGWLLIAAGLVLMGLAAITFHRFKTSIVPRRTPSALLTSGPFALSRNPIYLADLVILIGLVLVFGGLSGMLLVPLFWAAIHYRFILPEEQVLRETFGAEFKAYEAAVRRWL